MPSYLRALALFGSLGAAWSMIQCTELTKVDWSSIPQAGMSANAGTSSAGEPSAGGKNSDAGEGGQSGSTASGGDSGGTGG